MASHYKNLIAWQKAMQLVTTIYEVSDRFPKREWFGLTSQLRRAAVSVPSNIAEGQARFSHKEFIRFLRNARGSLAEIETQVLIAGNLNYISSSASEELIERVNEVSRIVIALTTAIQTRLQPQGET